MDTSDLSKDRLENFHNGPLEPIPVEGVPELSIAQSVKNEEDLLMQDAFSFEDIPFMDDENEKKTSFVKESELMKYSILKESDNELKCEVRLENGRRYRYARGRNT